VSQSGASPRTLKKFHPSRTVPLLSLFLFAVAYIAAVPSEESGGLWATGRGGSKDLGYLREEGYLRDHGWGLAEEQDLVLAEAVARAAKGAWGAHQNVEQQPQLQPLGQKRFE